MTEYESRNRVASTSNPLVQMLLAMKSYRSLWLVPLVIGTMAAVGYAYLAPKRYEARQTLVIRDDLMGDAYKPGRFDSQESLKSAQETLLEVARRPKVIRSVMKRLGPADGRPRDNWPDDDTIESMQGVIGVRAPNGEELGKSETIVLVVKAETRERAAAFVKYLLEEIEREWNTVRRARFQSMASELRQATDGARAEFEAAASRLQAMEQTVGADLADLRGLNDAQTGNNGLRQTLTEVKSELREAKRKYESTRLQRQILLNAYSDPEYSATPVELLESQPELAYLKQGLNEARLRLASDLGRFNETHPVVASDRAAIADLKKQIHDHLKAALEGVDAQLEERQRHLARLEQTVEEYTQRLDRLSAMRVQYEKRVQDYNNKLAVFRDLQEDLTRVESLASPETHVSLLTPIDEPQVSANPVGPSKKIIVLGGAVASFIFGIGLVLLFAPLDIVELPEPARNRRQGDAPKGVVTPLETVRAPRADENPAAREPDDESGENQTLPNQTLPTTRTDRDHVASLSDHDAVEDSAGELVDGVQTADTQSDGQADDFVDSQADTLQTDSMPLTEAVVVTAGPDVATDDVPWASIVETDPLTLGQASVSVTGLDAETWSPLSDAESCVPTEISIENHEDDGDSLVALTDDVVLSLSEELDSLISEPLWETENDPGLDATACEEPSTIGKATEDVPRQTPAGDGANHPAGTKVECGAPTPPHESDVLESAPAPSAKTSAERLLTAVPSIVPVDLGGALGNGNDDPEFLTRSIEAGLARSFCQQDTGGHSVESLESVEASLPSERPLENVSGGAANFATANDDDTGAAAVDSSSTEQGIAAVPTDESPEAVVETPQSECELDPWIDRSSKPAQPGGDSDSDRRDDSNKTAAENTVGHDAPESVEVSGPDAAQEHQQGASAQASDEPVDGPIGQHVDHQAANAEATREVDQQSQSVPQPGGDPPVAPRKVRPLRISELREQLEVLQSDAAPACDSPDGDGPTSIDEQIDRLSESLLKFCQSIQRPIDDVPPETPPSTPGPSTANHSE